MNGTEHGWFAVAFVACIPLYLVWLTVEVRRKIRQQPSVARSAPADAALDAALDAAASDDTSGDVGQPADMLMLPHSTTGQATDKALTDSAPAH